MEEKRSLTSQELDAFSRQLSLLHESHVRDIYREVWRKCEMVREDLPAPHAIQQLVRAWKVLWKWRRRLMHTQLLLSLIYYKFGSKPGRTISGASVTV